MSLGIIVVGLIFSLIFHVGTKEPRRINLNSTEVQHRKLSVYKWFLKPQFYLVCISIQFNSIAVIGVGWCGVHVH